MRTEVRVVRRQTIMVVNENRLLLPRPVSDRSDHAQQRKATQSGQRDAETERQAHPARQGISQQPADVREGKLRGKHGRQVFLVR